jgi:adenosylcobinamide-phosphate synthase
MNLLDFSYFIDSSLILLIALLIDTIFGEVPDRIHPTVWIGQVISFLKTRVRTPSPRYQKAGGVLLAIFVIALFAAPTFLLLFLVRQFLGWIAYIIVGAIVLKMTFAVKCMSNYTLPIKNALETGDLDKAKGFLHYIVRRDPATLDESHVISAAVESIAESTTDGVTSPIIYFALFGVPGAVAYRVINTLDSMVGYRDVANLNVGWFSAKLDTLANYVPARLTAALMILSAKILGEDWRGSQLIIRRDRHKMPSINAGWTIAAMAGALGAQLEKPNYYALGDNHGLSPDHIRRALRMMNVTIVLFAVVVVLPILLIEGFLLSLVGIYWKP